MTDHLQLIQAKLEHLTRMREYLAYSLSQVEKFLPLEDWTALGPEQHASTPMEFEAMTIAQRSSRDGETAHNAFFGPHRCA